MHTPQHTPHPGQPRYGHCCNPSLTHLFPEKALSLSRCRTYVKAVRVVYVFRVFQKWAAKNGVIVLIQFYFPKTRDFETPTQRSLYCNKTLQLCTPSRFTHCPQLRSSLSAAFRPRAFIIVNRHVSSSSLRQAAECQSPSRTAARAPTPPESQRLTASRTTSLGSCTSGRNS